jgi:hypothetical protein
VRALRAIKSPYWGGGGRNSGGVRRNAYFAARKRLAAEHAATRRYIFSKLHTTHITHPTTNNNITQAEFEGILEKVRGGGEAAFKRGVALLDFPFGMGGGVAGEDGCRHCDTVQARK